MEPGAPPEDAGTAPAEDEEEALDFDGDYKKSLRHSWEFAAIAQVRLRRPSRAQDRPRCQALGGVK